MVRSLKHIESAAAPDLPEVFKPTPAMIARDAAEEQMARQLGGQIGYGRMMQLGQQLWRESLAGQGWEGGEFSIGPCVSMTTPCGCNRYNCDWCCGAGWLTQKVKGIKDSILIDPSE